MCRKIHQTSASQDNCGDNFFLWRHCFDVPVEGVKKNSLASTSDVHASHFPLDL